MNQEELTCKYEKSTEVLELPPEELEHVAGGPEVENEPRPK
jgi:hypothetical protein